MENWEKRNVLEAQKQNLEAMLASEDYKIIKCIEASLTKDKLPYDIEQLHLVRQQYRDRINALETEITELIASEIEAIPVFPEIEEENVLETSKTTTKKK